MTTYAINSGAINVTPFPGAEAGLSLVELTGTVQVVCEIPSFTLRLHAEAPTQPKATGTAQTTKKSLLNAEQTVSATCYAGVLSKLQIPGQTVATALSYSGIRLKFPTQTTGLAQASYFTAGSYVSAAKSALASPSAVAVVSGRTRTPRAASTVATVLSQVSTQRKLAGYVSVVAIATTQAGIVMRNASGATTPCTATGTVSTRTTVTRGGTTQGKVTTSATALAKLRRYPVLQQAVATCFSIQPRQGISFFGIATANASANATIRLKISLSAAATARAIAASAAADYATAMPAPTERLMIVQGYDRRMEVTQ